MLPSVPGVPARRSASAVLAATVLVILLSILGACSDSTAPGVPRLGIGDTLSGELMDATAVDSFVVSINRKDPVVVILEPLGNRLTMTVTDPTGRAAGQVTGDGLGPSRELATRLITPNTNGPHLVRVSVPVDGTPGAYRISVVRPVIGPERIHDIATPGDTVSGEGIEHVDDVDDFYLEAPPGTEVMAFVRNTGAIPGALALTTFLGAEPIVATSAGWGDDIDQGVPSVFTMPSSGRAYFRVSMTNLDRSRFIYPLWYDLLFVALDAEPGSVAARIERSAFTEDEVLPATRTGGRVP